MRRIKGACDNEQLGNLTTVIQGFRPAVDDVAGIPGERTSKNSQFVTAVVQANVRRTVAGIRKNSSVLSEMEKTGKIRIVGAMQNLATGEVTFIQ